MNQDDLARRIVQRLNVSLDDIPAAVVKRLQAARREALRRTRAREPRQGSLLDWLRDWVWAHGTAVRVAVPAAFAIAVAAGLLYWQVASHHESIELETALLADELPIHAYTDPGFDAWLQETLDD